MKVDHAVSELWALPLHALPLSAVVQRVAELARDRVPGADEASVTLFEGERATVAVFTGSLGTALDDRQHAPGFGPHLGAAQGPRVVTITDTSCGGEHAAYCQLARRAGVRASVSIGLEGSEQVRGALTLYDTGGAGLDDVSLEVGRTFAGCAAMALATATALEGRRELVEQLQRAMATRAVIEQAKGVVVAHRGIGPEQAFGLISRRSQDTNRKLAVLAAEVVAAAEAGRGLDW